MTALHGAVATRDVALDAHLRSSEFGRGGRSRGLDDDSTARGTARDRRRAHAGYKSPGYSLVGINI